mmetsp:Transcript_38742/g.102913  ORF Transcript_38742/g.102913 Transcript_38742/m.102913 type:complete len:231 (-) Transcript_38742:244-936(-)
MKPPPSTLRHALRCRTTTAGTTAEQGREAGERGKRSANACGTQATRSSVDASMRGVRGAAWIGARTRVLSAASAHTARAQRDSLIATLSSASCGGCSWLPSHPPPHSNQRRSNPHFCPKPPLLPCWGRRPRRSEAASGGAPFLRSSGLPFFTVAITMLPTVAPGILFRRPLMPFTEMMYRFFAPVLSAQFITEPTHRPSVVRNLLPIEPPRPRFDIAARVSGPCEQTDGA